MSIDARLSELNITLPAAPAPAANYVPAVQSGNLLFVSGQIPAGPEGLIRGRLGADLDVAAGAQAVGDGVERGAAPALLGDGPTREGAVGASGLGAGGLAADGGRVGVRHGAAPAGARCGSRPRPASPAS